MIKDEKIDYKQQISLHCNECDVSIEFNLTGESEFNQQYNTVVNNVLKKESFFTA